MLQRKQAEQRGVDEQRHSPRPGRTGINRLRDENIADKSRGVKKRGEKDRITNDAKREDQNSLHQVFLSWK